jgi:hypothetical protein
MTLQDRPEFDIIFACKVPVAVDDLIRIPGSVYRVKECSERPEGGYYVGAVLEGRPVTDADASPA